MTYGKKNSLLSFHSQDGACATIKTTDSFTSTIFAVWYLNEACHNPLSCKHCKIVLNQLQIKDPSQFCEDLFID